MTQQELFDLNRLGRNITEYCKAMENFRAVKEGRMMLAKGLRDKYPNMKIEAIRNTLWRQEEDMAKVAQLAFDGLRGDAYSLGWKFDYKDVHNELTGILRTNYPSLNDINI